MYALWEAPTFHNQKTKTIWKRIKNNAAAQRFYRMFLQWRAKGMSYGEMINRLLAYWERDNRDLLYVGSTWGEIAYQGYNKLWISLKTKTHAQKVNIAIAKIKEEQDFLDFKLMPFIEVLKDLELIEDAFYDQIKFGTDNQQLIALLKNGLSLELSKLLLNEYSQLLSFDITKGLVSFSSTLLKAMEGNNENPILIFEVQTHI